jgi:hypothetical protein
MAILPRMKKPAARAVYFRLHCDVRVRIDLRSIDLALILKIVTRTDRSQRIELPA